MNKTIILSLIALCIIPTLTYAERRTCPSPNEVRKFINDKRILSVEKWDLNTTRSANLYLRNHEVSKPMQISISVFNYTPSTAFPERGFVKNKTLTKKQFNDAIKKYKSRLSTLELGTHRLGNSQRPGTCSYTTSIRGRQTGLKLSAAISMPDKKR